MKNLTRPSSYDLNINSLYISGKHVRLDDWQETFLIDEKPLALPSINPFIASPSEIGLQPPNYFVSFPYTGLSLYEEYLSNAYIVTGWTVSLGKSGVGPAHYNQSNQLIYSPLSGDVYTRSVTDPNIRSTIASFYIDSGQFFVNSTIPETGISGNSIIGWNMYYGLSGAEDLIVSLAGQHSDINESNVSNGVIMSSGDSAISFFLEYGSITGETVLEYYLPNEFIATRWGLYSASTGSSTIGNGDPLTLQTPLSGRFYYRDPKTTTRTTVTTFSMPTGVYSSIALIPSQQQILPRKIVGIDIYNGLNNLSNLHLVLGGRSVSSANYFKNVVTKNIFDIFSGYITGLITQSTAGVSFLNNSNGAIDLIGQSGIQISNAGYPSQTITVKYTSGNFNNIDFTPQAVDLPYQEGRIYYSNDTKTFNAYLDKSDVTLNIGQEEYIRVVNKTSNTILNGTPVYISGAQGNRPQAWVAMASGIDSLYHIDHLIGVATHNILNNEEGLITTNGIVGDVNTSSFGPGDILYLGSTGGLVNVLPSPLASYGKKIGYAINSSNNGKILVKISDTLIGPYKNDAISFSLTGYVNLSGTDIRNSGILEQFVPNNFVATGIEVTCALATGIVSPPTTLGGNRLSGYIYQKRPENTIWQRSPIAPWQITGGNIFSGFSFDATNSFIGGPTSPILVTGGYILSLDISGLSGVNRYRGINVALLGKSE